MTRLAALQICTMTELREPQKVFDRAGGQPIPILKNSALIGSYIPAEAVGKVDARPATMGEVMESLRRTRASVQPVLDFLKDNDAAPPAARSGRSHP